MRPRPGVVALILGVIAVAAGLFLRPVREVPRFDLRVEAAPGDAGSFVARLKAVNAAAREWFRQQQSLKTHWADHLSIHASPSEAPLFGTFEATESELRFHPSVPPVAGAVISAVFNEGWTTAAYQVPEQDHPAPRVLSIHPSADVLPENLIKFYIEFSTPMTQGDFFQHVALRNEQTSQLVPGAFREVELWSPDGRRFTLWLHPGRQKTGVNLNEDEGPVLREGGRYTLQILDTLTARSGARLTGPAGKTFTVGPHDSTKPEMKLWHLAVPTKGTRAPLTLSFDKPLDRAMLDSAIWITNAAGELLKGTAAAPSDEREWRFTPKEPWQAGTYDLTANPELEDLAGNSLARTFETPTAQPGVEPLVWALQFKVDP